MKTTIAQVLFDFIRMNDTLIKFMNVANRKSKNVELCKTYVNISLECRIFLEQLNAEIKTQKQVLNDTLIFEPMVNIKWAITLEDDKHTSPNTVEAKAMNQLMIMIANYSKILEVTELRPTTHTMMATQRKTLEAYARELQKHSSKH